MKPLLTAVAAVTGLGLAANVQRTPMLPNEQQVIGEINRARMSPIAYSETLRQYRTYFEGSVVHLPGNPVGIRTSEGVAAVDEAIAALRRQPALPALGESALLAQAAADHVRDQGPFGLIGHDGRDGSGPGERVRRRGGGRYVAEVISYGTNSAADVVRQLIVDDRVPSRGHRTILLSARYRFAGVACGPHAVHGTMCVVNLSTTANGNYR